MGKNIFYNHVSSWIDSYYNAEAMEWLRRFINNSAQPQDVKDALNKQVDLKIASLTNAPLFEKYERETYLMDKHGHPEIFTTRYAAVGKVAQLRNMGYDVRLQEGNVFFRIVLLGYKITEIDSVELNPAQL